MARGFADHSSSLDLRKPSFKVSPGFLCLSGVQFEEFNGISLAPFLKEELDFLSRSNDDVVLGLSKVVEPFIF